MSLVLTSLLLLATPIQAVVMDTRPLEGVDASKASLVTEEIARTLPPDAFKVTTAAQLAAVMGLERQKQLLGCSDAASSCVAELANALGADVVVHSTLGKVGEGYRCNVIFILGKDGTALRRSTIDATSEGALLAQVHEELTIAAADVFSRQRPGSRIEPGQPGVRKYAWVPGVGSIALAALGAVMFGLSAATWSQLSTMDGLTPNQARGLASNGSTTDTLGVTFFVIGGAALAAAVVTFIIGAPSEPRVVLAPVAGPGAGGVSLSGAFP